MKAMLAICMIVAAPLAWSGEKSVPSVPASGVVAGEVLEVRDVESYTYLRLKTREGETWAAVDKAPVRKGAEVTIVNAMVMNNFESKSLKKTFPSIVFGSLGGAGAAPLPVHGMATTHAGLGGAMDVLNIHVPKASGANARSVAEIVSRRAELKDKPVLVRAKVVKYNPAIMGKNWVHLRDGSGSAADGSNDVLVTTASQAKVGDVVTAKGIVRTDKDFGAGYSYKVLVEDATLQP